MRFCEEHLGTMARIKAIYRNRPVLSLDDARCVLAKHGLGRAVGVEVLGATPYFMNFVYRVDQEGGSPVVLKGQHLPAMGWDLSQEALVVPLLRKGTSLPLPDWALYDGDRDALAWPYALIAWRDGSLDNTMARPDRHGRPRLCGVFDFQGAVLMQRRWDLSKAFSAFVPGTDPDREPTPEWEAFCRGYGRDARPALDGAEAQTFAAVYPALQVRHWWEPFGLFHPRTPGWIEDLLAALDRLARGA